MGYKFYNYFFIGIIIDGHDIGAEDTEKTVWIFWIYAGSISQV